MLPHAGLSYPPSLSADPTTTDLGRKKKVSFQACLAESRHSAFEEKARGQEAAHGPGGAEWRVGQARPHREQDERKRFGLPVRDAGAS